MRERGLTFHTLVHVPSPPHVRPYAEDLGNGLYVMSLERTPQSVVPLLVKRLIDVVGGLAGVLVFGAAYIICAPLDQAHVVRAPCSSSTPASARMAACSCSHKFRTMRSDAEAHKAALAGANAMRGHVFKMKKDPRVTKAGRVLRALLPRRAAAVLERAEGRHEPGRPAAAVAGGSRRLCVVPPPPAERPPRHHRSVAGPGNGVVADFEEIVRMECDYIDQWSLWLDILVMVARARPSPGWPASKLPPAPPPARPPRRPLLRSDTCEATRPEPFEIVLRPDTGWRSVELPASGGIAICCRCSSGATSSRKYKQTVLGPLWFVIQPLSMTLVFTVIFGKIAGLSTDGLPPVLFYLCGQLGWNYFAQNFASNSATFVNNAALFGKVYFPRLVVPLAALVSNLLAFAIQLATFVCFYLYFNTAAAPAASAWTGTSCCCRCWCSRPPCSAWASAS